MGKKIKVEEERLYFRKQISERKVLNAIKANTGNNQEDSQIALRASAYELLQLGAKCFMEQNKKN